MIQDQMAFERPSHETKSNSSSSDTSSQLFNPLDLHNDDGWDDSQDEIEELQIICLFNDAQFPNVVSMLDHCEKNHAWDIAKHCRELGTDLLYFQLH